MKRLVTFTLALPLLLGAASVAQSSYSPATLRLSVDPPVVKVGVPIFLEAVLTNRSGLNMAIGSGYTGAFDFSMEIDLRDDKGGSPPETKLYRCAQGKEVCAGENGGTLVFLGNAGSRGILPNESLRTIAELNRLYDLAPGMYVAAVRFSVFVQQEDACDVPVLNAAYRFCHVEWNTAIYDYFASMQQRDPVIIASTPVIFFVTPE